MVRFLGKIKKGGWQNGKVVVKCDRLLCYLGREIMPLIYNFALGRACSDDFVIELRMHFKKKEVIVRVKPLDNSNGPFEHKF